MPPPPIGPGNPVPPPPRTRPPQPAPPAAPRAAAPVATSAAPATISTAPGATSAAPGTAPAALRTATASAHTPPFRLPPSFLRRQESTRPRRYAPAQTSAASTAALRKALGRVHRLSFRPLSPFRPLPSFQRRQESTPPRRCAPPRTPVATRTAALFTTLTLLAFAAIWLAACSEPAPPVQQQPAQPEPEPPPTQVLVLSEDDLGGHLKATEWAAGVMEWIAELQDPTLSALPRRALWNDGRIFVPSADSPSGETFWLHVFTDESPQSAQAWVRYLASLPPDAVLNFTSPEHRLVEAAYIDPPNVGSAALAVELLHGNAGGRFRTEVIVFAQQAAIVILRNSRSESRPALTDLPTIATQISARLAAPN